MKVQPCYSGEVMARELTNSLAAKFLCRALISPWKPEDASAHLSALNTKKKQKWLNFVY